MRRLLLLAVLSLALPSCQAKPFLVKPRLENEGQLFVYLKSLPQEADRLAFRFKEISAVQGDGKRVPLSLHAEQISGGDPRRNRLLASGNLPPGEYQGFSFSVSNATLEGEEGKVDLLPTGERSDISFSFSIRKRKALVVSLAFRYRESFPGGIRFFPSFSARIPETLATGRIGLVASRDANAITLFDKFSGEVVAVVPTGSSPAGVTLNPVLLRAYVAISGEDTVEVIDLIGADVIDRGRLTIGDSPEELVLTPDRRILLSANAGSNTVSVIDASSLIEKTRIQVGNGPHSILVDRAGRRAYVFNTLSSTISILDVVRMAVIKTVATEAEPLRGDFDQSGNRLYVLHRSSPYLNVLDPTTLSVINRIYVGTGGMALKVDGRTGLIYLVRRGTGEVSIYDPFSFLPVDSYRIPGDASHLVIDGEGNNLWVVLPNSGSVRAVRLVGKRTVWETEVAEDPYRVTLMGER